MPEGLPRCCRTRRTRGVVVVLAGCFLTTGGLLLSGGGSGTASAPPPAANTEFLQVRTPHTSQSSTLVAVNPATGATLRTTRLDYTVNAVGYDSAQDLLYGVASRRGGRSIGDGGHLVAIRRDGRTTDLGPARASGGKAAHVTLSTADAGAVANGQLYLLSGSRLFVVGIRPGSASYLRLTRTAVLLCDPELGDWDYYSTENAFYGVSTPGLLQPSRLVRVDAASGRVVTRPLRGHLPGHGSYGAAGLDRAVKTLYAMNNSSGVLLRISLADGSTTKIATGPALQQNDGALVPIRKAPPPPAPSPRPPTPPAPPPPPPPPGGPPPPPPPPRTAPMALPRPPAGIPPQSPPASPQSPPPTPQPSPTTPLPSAVQPAPEPLPRASTVRRPPVLSMSDNQERISRFIVLILGLAMAGSTALRLRRRGGDSPGPAAGHRRP